MVENLPLFQDSRSSAASRRRLLRDLRTLIKFVSVYCEGLHGECSRTPFHLRAHDVAALAGRDVHLCEGCHKLLAHALVKRTHCPFDPKPACKRCSSHCYHPKYRDEICRAMRFSGRKLLLSGRIDYLLHLLF